MQALIIIMNTLVELVAIRLRKNNEHVKLSKLTERISELRSQLFQHIYMAV